MHETKAGDDERPSASRRAVLAGAIGMAATSALAGGADTWAVPPRQRVIIDNDFSGDPDGLFQLAHHLLSPSVDIPFIIGSHIHAGDFFDPSLVQADNAVARVAALMATLPGVRRPDIVAGRNNVTGAPGLAVQRIITEALREDTKLPLFYAAGAGLSELADAVRREPRIASRLTLAWIGGMEHADLLPGVPERHDLEYNQTIDLAAVQFLFNDSTVEIWQVPRNVYRQMLIGDAELQSGLGKAGDLGAFLLEHLMGAKARFDDGLGETYILGDSPLVTLTALQSPYEPDSASSPYVIRPTPRISDNGQYIADPNGRPMRVYTGIDTRLTFGDMLAKMQKAG